MYLTGISPGYIGIGDIYSIYHLSLPVYIPSPNIFGDFPQVYIPSPHVFGDFPQVYIPNPHAPRDLPQVYIPHPHVPGDSYLWQLFTPSF